MTTVMTTTTTTTSTPLTNFGRYTDLSVERTTADRGNIFILKLQKAPENRLNVAFCQELIRALNDVRRAIGPDAPGAVILRGGGDFKYFCTGVDLDERDSNPYASSEGFYPLIHTLLDYPFPTICMITGHVFGGGTLLTLAHDYRIMNRRRGYWCFPAVDLGLHFDGMGALLRAKLPNPAVARKVVLRAHRYTGLEALEDGIVDEVAEPGDDDDDDDNGMLRRALDLAGEVQERAKMGVYGLLRGELCGEAARAFQRISYVHSRVVSREARIKL